MVRFTSRSSRDGFTGPVVFAVLLIVLALSAIGLVRRGPLVQASKATIEMHGQDEDTPRHTGSIVIPTTAAGVCRHLLFDNRSGDIREVDTGKCIDIAPNTNSTEGRVGAIRRSFSKQPD